MMTEFFDNSEPKIGSQDKLYTWIPDHECPDESCKELHPVGYFQFVLHDVGVSIVYAHGQEFDPELSENPDPHNDKDIPCP